MRTRHFIFQKLFVATVVFALPTLLSASHSAWGDAPPCRYTFPVSETVKDTETELTWQRTLDAALHSRAQAAAYCQALALDGVGWRLPTVKELQSIVDVAKTSPSIDAAAFPNTPPASFWTSSPYVLSANYGWDVVFTDGGNSGVDATASLHVRCVR